MKKASWPGHGWKVSCHRCGMWSMSTEIRKEWTGLLVCPKCYESRHPQTLIKVHGEKAFPSFVSKDGPDVFIPGAVCTIATRSAYADMGTADCMQADNGVNCQNIADVGDADYALVDWTYTYTYDFLLGLFGNGH